MCALLLCREPPPAALRKLYGGQPLAISYEACIFEREHGAARAGRGPRAAAQRSEGVPPPVDDFCARVSVLRLPPLRHWVSRFGRVLGRVAQPLAAAELAPFDPWLVPMTRPPLGSGGRELRASPIRVVTRCHCTRTTFSTPPGDVQSLEPIQQLLAVERCCGPYIRARRCS